MWPCIWEWGGTMFEKKLDKVIAALEIHKNIGDGESCPKCPYEEYEIYCLTVLERDALELLKEYRKCLTGFEMSGDLISRSALLESIEGTDWYTIRCDGTASEGAPCEEVAWYKATDMYAALENAPAVEAEPVVHAHWEFLNDYQSRCSHCRSEVFVDHNDEPPFCERCGAHMDEEVADA